MLPGVCHQFGSNKCIRIIKTKKQPFTLLTTHLLIAVQTKSELLTIAYKAMYGKPSPSPWITLLFFLYPNHGGYLSFSHVSRFCSPLAFIHTSPGIFFMSFFTWLTSSFPLFISLNYTSSEKSLI